MINLNPANTLTAKDLVKLFRRSELTIHIWKRDKGLPHIRIPGSGRDTIRFDRPSVLTWAKENGKRTFIVEEVSNATG